MEKKNKVVNCSELLAPAGSLEKMKIALEFGADAVYFGLPDFSLRARINKFGKKEIKEGAELCRRLGKKFYVTINIYAHNKHIEKLPKHLEFINEIKPDAVILSDPGVLRVVKKECPEVPIHLSTQANATNAEAVKFWAEYGVERIILARELSLPEIGQIKKEVPDMELEAFVHGAMCMSYSGRCILSKWMTNRSANLGDCSQPCRWAYRQIPNNKLQVPNKSQVQNYKSKTEDDKQGVSVVDDKDRFMMDLEEDQHGTYFFNSYDICLIEHLDKLMKAGVDSFKIEGRGKSVYYVATVTRAYRAVIDSASLLSKGKITQKEMWQIATEQKRELEKLSHRGYWTGFVLGDEPPHLTKEAYKKTDWEFVGVSREDEESKTRKVFVHNVLKKGDQVEIIGAEKTQKTEVVKIKNAENLEIESAHGGQDELFTVEFKNVIKGIFLARKSEK